MLEQKEIAAYIIGDDVLDQPLSVLFEAGEDFDGRHQEFPDAYMICDGITVNELVDLILFLEVNHAPFNGIKVVRNAENANAKLKDVFTQSRRAHVLTERAMELGDLISSCSGINIADEVNSKNIQEFKRCLLDAFMTLKSGNYSEEQIEKVTVNLRESLKGVEKLYN